MRTTPFRMEDFMEEDNKGPNIHIREWLNENKGFAAVEVDGNVWKGKRGRSVDLDITLRDCNRQVNLEFYADDEKDYERVCRKMALLKKIINDAEEFLLANPPEKFKKEEKKEQG